MRTLYRIGVVALVGLVGLGLFPGSGEAAMIKLRLEQLAAEADTIVLGTVTSQASAWNAQHTAIYTDVTVAVEEVIKGTPGAEVTFRVAGGIVGDIGMRTSNDPVFQKGERVILFLDTREVPARIVGLHQGKYPVRDGTVKWDGRVVAVGDFIDAIRAASR